jgi:hypothetical protein
MVELIAFDAINVPIQLTRHGIYENLCGLVTATGVQLMVIVESMDPGYKHEQHILGDIGMKASVAQLPVPGKLAMWQKNMARHDPESLPNFVIKFL